MSCPTCSQTMQNLGVQGQRIFWCPRCGTLREYNGDFHRDELPIWLRQVVLASGIRRPGEAPATNTTRHAGVDAWFKIDQTNDDAPRIELHLPR